MTDPRLTLAIEASNPSASESRPGVAIGRAEGSGVEVFGVEYLRSTSRHDDDLLPAIDRLWGRLEAAGSVASKRTLRRIAVSTGPGGFTGLRVAIAAAKMLALTSGGECVGVPSAAVAAHNVADPVFPFAVCLASKRGTTIATVFDAPGAWGKGREVDSAGLAELGVGVVIADRFLPEPIRAWCASAGVEVREPAFDPVACLHVASDLPSIDAFELTPIYGREPEAVRKWRELQR